MSRIVPLVVGLVLFFTQSLLAGGKEYSVDKNSGEAPFSVRFDASGIKSAKKFLWSFGDGQTFTSLDHIVTYQYKKVGTFTASLTIQQNASDKNPNYKDMGSVVITVKEKPNQAPYAYISCSVSNLLASCSSLASYDIENQPLTFKFEYGDNFTESNSNGLSSHAYAVAGLYNVKVTVTDSLGASSVATTSVQAVRPPNALPVPKLACSSTKPQTLDCSASGSSDSDGNIVSYQYTFDDGSVVSKADNSLVSHVFSSAGNHSIELKIVDNDGGEGTIISNVDLKINTPPSFNLYASSISGVAPLTVNFQTQNAVDSDGEISSYEWSFSDNGVETTANTTHTFNAVGTFTVTLKVTDNLGASTVKSTSITTLEPLKTPPTAFFKYDQGEEQGTYLTLHASQMKTQFDIKRAYYTVDNSRVIELTEFLPNTLSTVEMGSYGPHTITFTVVDVRDQIATFTHNFNLKSNPSEILPYVNFNFRPSAPRTMFFNYNLSFTSDYGEEIDHFHIDYGDGKSEDTADYYTNHQFPAAGTYLVRVTAFTTSGTRNVAGRNVVVTNAPAPLVLPIVSFGYKIYSFAQNVSFYDERSGSPNGGIISYFWDFGDGETATGRDVVHFYNPGSYFVKLQVTDFAGYTVSQTQHITINGAGDDLAANMWCEQNYVTADCYAVAIDKYNQINHVQFSWGDSQSTLGELIDSERGIYHANHVYSRDGNFSVGVNVGTERGQFKNISTQISLVNNAPMVGGVQCDIYNFEVYCYPKNSSDPEGGALVFDFDFGDGNIFVGDQYGVGHNIYNLPGNYIVKMKATDPLGKSVVVQTGINIVNRPPVVGNIECDLYGLEVICSPAQAFDPDGRQLSFEFDFGDGVVETNNDGIGNHVYSQFGNYNVVLKVKDPQGGTTVVQKEINVHNNQPVVGNLQCDIYGKEVYCYPIEAFDPDGGSLSFEFSFGDGDVETNTDGVGHHFYSQYGNFNVGLKVTDQFGGEATTSKPIIIVNYAPIAFINCTVNNLLVNCNAAGSYDPEGENLHYKYDFGDGTSEENDYGWVTHAYTQAGLSTVTLKITDVVGNITQTSTQVMPLIPPNQMPIANFDCNIDTVRTVYCWEIGTYDPDGSIAIKKFSFDDNTSDFYNPPDALRHQFSTGGEHAITYTIVDNDGGVTSVSKKFAVKENQNPIANFECTTPSPQRIKCYSTSTDPDNGDLPSTFEWEFGDGNSTGGLQGYFDHYYSESSTYTVKLIVHDQFGGSSSIEKQITTIENKAPVAHVECFVTTGTTYQCNSDVYDVDGQVVEQKWTIDDVAFSGSNIMYEFTNGGEHEVVLKVKDDLGMQTEVSSRITINKPKIVATCSEISPFIIHCDATNSEDSEHTGIMNYKIYFNEEEVFVGPVAQYEFQTIGSKKVRIELANGSNNKSTLTLSVLVNAKYTAPKPVFYTDVELGKIVKFNAEDSLLQGRKILSYEWIFGDGQKIVTTEPKIQHTYNENAYYDVSLKVTDETGATGTIAEQIYVYDPIVADPGEFGKSNLLGVDSDSNGIRDDIQRWIQSEANDNLDKKRYLEAVALIYEDNFKRADQPPSIAGNFLKKFRYEQCLKLVESDESKVEELKSLTAVLYINTNQRAKKFLDIENSFAGLVLENKMEMDELEVFCQGVGR